MRLLVFLTASAALWAQEPNIQGPKTDELLKKSGAANDANGPKARQYLYREYTVTTELNEKGEPSSRHTETWEAIGLEGSEYRKLIQRDDKALTAKEQKQEDERLRKEADRRRKPKTGGSKNPLSRTYTFSYVTGDDRFFDFRYAGQEDFNGRPAYVLEGTPKSGVKPANDHEKQLLVSRLKRWIDKEEFFESGFEVEVTGTGGDARPGSVIGVKHQRMEDGAWLVEEMHIRFIVKPLRIGDRRMEMVITRSDFHKFAVDSRIVEVQ
jgi:hypothetical protein